MRAMATRIKKRCITREEFTGKVPPDRIQVKGERLTFWVDQSMSRGFEVKLLEDGIEVRGMGVPPSLSIEPAVSNVVTIKLRRMDDPPPSKLGRQGT